MDRCDYRTQINLNNYIVYVIVLFIQVMRTRLKTKARNN